MRLESMTQITFMISFRIQLSAQKISIQQLEFVILIGTVTLQWRHNEHDGVSNHWRLECLVNRLFRRRSKKTSKLRVTGRWPANSPHKGPVTWKCSHLITSSRQCCSCAFQQLPERHDEHCDSDNKCKNSWLYKKLNVFTQMWQSYH